MCRISELASGEIEKIIVEDHFSLLIGEMLEENGCHIHTGVGYREIGSEEEAVRTYEVYAFSQHSPFG